MGTSCLVFRVTWAARPTGRRLAAVRNLRQLVFVYLCSERFMIVPGVLCLLIGGAAVSGPAPVQLRAPTLDTVALVSSLRGQPDSMPRWKLNIATDTIRPRRRRAIEISEWYSRRLTIHRYVAYATIPIFALQYAAGNQLYTKGAGAPTWAKTMHRVGATALAGMFTVNTVTGAWNWWDSRSAPQGRVLRTVHALTMLGADAAFTYAGAKLSNEAETSGDKRRLHRTIALASMGVSIASGLAMKIMNR